MEPAIAEYYGTLEEIDREADLIVVVTAGSAEQEQISTAMFTVTNARVEQVIRGGGSVSEGTELLIRHTGTATQVAAEFPAPLSRAESYLLYLRPFVFVEGESTGQWIVVGPGQWKESEGSFKLDVIGSTPGVIPNTLDPVTITD